MKLLIKICYDGAAYAGFQFQKNAPSVQKALTAAARTLFGEGCEVTGCSRTDAGVHAKGFMAALSSDAPDAFGRIPPERVPEAMNFHLPEDIAVLSCTVVPEAFHPRYSAESKTYEYLIVNSVCRHPLMRGRAYMPRRLLSAEDILRMDAAAKTLLGTHDFSSYMSAGSSVMDTVRTVTDASVTEKDGLIVFRVSANGFLYNMVRILAGTLYAVGCGRLSAEDIPRITEAHDRKAAGSTLPPEGLYLTEVRYPPEAFREEGGSR